MSNSAKNKVDKIRHLGAFFRLKKYVASLARLNRFCAIKHSHTKPLIKPLYTLLKLLKLITSVITVTDVY